MAEPAPTQGSDPKAPALLGNGDLRLRRCRHGHMLYSLNDGYIGRALDTYGEYVEDEAELYQRLLQPGQVAVEAGANIGALTVVMAQAVGPNGRVITFEPQRVLYQMLCANLALNGLRNVHAALGGFGAETMTMNVPPVNYDRLENFGGVTLQADGPGEPVSVVPIDSFSLPICHLIKIDVEGMELEVLEGARETIKRHAPVIYLENNIREKSPALIGWLLEHDYRLFWHRPRLFRVPNYRGHEADIFDNTINVNMLCLPPRVQGDPNLDAVTSPEDWWQE